MLSEMKMLLWKDFRLSRICILASIILTFVPYLFLFAPKVFFFMIWPISAYSSQLTMAILAGNIIACERFDRSAQFLAFQGASRKMVISSKLIICTIAFILVCAITLVLSLCLPWENYKITDMFLDVIASFALIGFCFFGCCWLWSSLLSSPAIAIALGFIMPFLILFTISATNYFFNFPKENTIGYWSCSIFAVAGLISLVAGTWHFLRSKES
jgi:hypothetical protein